MTTDTLMSGAQDTTDAATQQSTDNAAVTQPNAGATDQGTTATADTGKTGEAAKSGQDEGKKEGDKAAAEYTDFTAPEGMELDADLLGELKTYGKEHGLNQEQAQKLVDMGAKLVQKQQQAFSDMVDGWANDARADKEFGGDKFDENLGVAKKALDTFGSPAFKEALKHTGMGNHPELIRFAFKVGKAISEDGFVKGAAGQADADPAASFYPSMKK